MLRNECRGPSEVKWTGADKQETLAGEWSGVPARIVATPALLPAQRLTGPFKNGAARTPPPFYFAEQLLFVPTRTDNSDTGEDSVGVVSFHSFQDD
jgi:hypothetical protein